MCAARAGVPLTRKLLACTIGLNWLNDDVVNSTMALFQERECRMNPVQPRVHYWNSFFHNMLSKGKLGYEKVLHWGHKLPYCLLECDKIVVPIHQGLHWVLAVIHVKEKRLEFLDSMFDSTRRDNGSLVRVSVRTTREDDRYLGSNTTHQP